MRTAQLVIVQQYVQSVYLPFFCIMKSANNVQWINVISAKNMISVNSALMGHMSVLVNSVQIVINVAHCVLMVILIIANNAHLEIIYKEAHVFLVRIK